ncbi:hypothetical protein Vadar_022389 [Vaccinium darrowii]|uniref:Uncharacterized protein n=1 Tax=Vaccinium darrowii TaxID=229202 RepID=A0ACB7ZCZ1_9ERIC|nr:hypothetical protein Vadar_022389 [Vaccinium darrowii]
MTSPSSSAVHFTSFSNQLCYPCRHQIHSSLSIPPSRLFPSHNPFFRDLVLYAGIYRQLCGGTTSDCHLFSRRIPNEHIREQLGDLDTLTEEKIDRIVIKFLHDLKQDSLEANGWQKMVPAYSISKAALNAYTRVVAKRSKLAYGDNDSGRGSRGTGHVGSFT